MLGGCLEKRFFKRRKRRQDPAHSGRDYFMASAAGDYLVKRTIDRLVKAKGRLAVPEMNQKLRVQSCRRLQCCTRLQNLLLLRNRLIWVSASPASWHLSC
jgi:hypothetical protein